MSNRAVPPPPLTAPTPSKTRPRRVPLIVIVVCWRGAVPARADAPIERTEVGVVSAELNRAVAHDVAAIAASTPAAAATLISTPRIAMVLLSPGTSGRDRDVNEMDRI